MHKENIKAFIAWINVCILWGTTYLAIRIGVTDLPPMLFAGVRWLVAGLILLSFLKIKKYQLPSLKEIRHIAVIGILLLGFGNGLVVLGEKWVPSGLAALIITTVPLWVVIIEAFIPGAPRINMQIILGLLIGFAGVVLIFWGNLGAVYGSAFITGAVCLAIAVFTWACGSVYSRYYPLKIHPLMSSAVQMLIAGPLQILLGLLLGESKGLTIELNGTLALIYLIMFGSLIGYTSYIYAISHLPVSFVTTYAYINPVIALFLGWLILDEKLSFTIILSAAVIFAGVALVKTGTDKETARRRAAVENKSI